MGFFHAVAAVHADFEDLKAIAQEYPKSQNILKYQDLPNKGQLFAARSTYKLSNRTAVYATLGYMENSGNAAFGTSNAQAGRTPIAGVNQTGLGVDIRHVF